MSDPSAITTHPPRAQITRELVQPPSRVYLTVDDKLYIRSRNALSGVTLRLAGRMLTPDGAITPFNFEHTPATDRSASLESFQLAEGFLLSAVVFPSVGAPIRGQTFVELGLLRGLDVGASVVDVLAKDYVAENEPVAFPGSPIRSSIEGPGAVRSITGTDPAAGVEISETVPTDALWQLRATTARLLADATVASRFPTLRITDGGVLVYTSRTHAAQTASQTRDYNLLQHGFFETPAVISHYHNILPVAFLAAGTVIDTNTIALQAGDNWTAPRLLVEEWLED